MSSDAEGSFEKESLRNAFEKGHEVGEWFLKMLEGSVPFIVTRNPYDSKTDPREHDWWHDGFDRAIFDHWEKEDVSLYEMFMSCDFKRLRKK